MAQFITLVLLISILESTKLTVLSLQCYCQGSCPNGQPNGTCEAPPGAGCFAAAEEVYDPETDSMVAERTYGCLPSEEGGLMMCRGNLSPHAVPTAIQCCKSGDFCNRILFPMYDLSKYKDDIEDDDDDSDDIWELDPAVFHLVLLCTVTVCVVSLVFLVTWIYLKYKTREMNKQQYLYRRAQQTENQFGVQGTIHDLIEQSSGSGAGLPLLVQRTIAKQVSMSSKIGQGRYGEVWLARWRGEKVAVKIFFTTEEASWFRETEIYQTVLMRHDNILGFIAADIKGTGGWTQMLLVTDYYEHGSLYDYLQTHVLDRDSLARLAHTTACGLSHLHTEIFGSKGKPAIAHRDIKSRNILVKNDGTAAIADFGLAVRYNSDTESLDISPNTRVGTRRYMAPEILNNSLNVNCFESFKAADIYCLGLVLWEMARRTVSVTQFQDKVQASECQLPYYDVLPGDPSHQDVYQAVCIKKIRPHHPPQWHQCASLRLVSNLINECVHENPSVRPTALRVKKTLSKLLRSPSFDQHEEEKSRNCPSRLPVPGYPIKMV